MNSDTGEEFSPTGAETNSSGYTHVIITNTYKPISEPSTGGYKVVHEYYYRDADGKETLEGTTTPETIDKLELNKPFTSAEQKPVYEGTTYDSAIFKPHLMRAGQQPASPGPQILLYRPALAE